VCVCVCVCVWGVDLLPRKLEITCIDPHKTGFGGKSSDRLSWLNFGRPAPREGGLPGANFFLAPPYYSQAQRALFASPLSAFFIALCNLEVRTSMCSISDVHVLVCD